MKPPVKYILQSPSGSTHTAKPEKYPQGYFKDKPCKRCGEAFSPKAPSHMYCCDHCKDLGLTNAYLMRNYGINFKEYQEIFKSQRGLCKICGSEGFLIEPKSRIKLGVDHCHKDGHTRGMLCHNCNRGLGLFQEDISNLRSAIEYLEDNGKTVDELLGR